MASICCSPPDSLVPWLRAPLLQVGEQPVDLVDAHAAFGDLGRQRQVLRDVEAGEDAALLRHVADAGARDPVQRQRRSVLPAKRIAPSRLRTMPMMARSVVVLPAPLRPRSVTVSPSRTSSVDAVQHVALAVPGVEVADFESSGRVIRPCSVPI